MARHTFNFADTREIIEVNGEEFTLDLSDGALKRQQKKFRTFAVEYMDYAKEVESLDPEEVTPEKEAELWGKAEDMLRDTIDTTLGAGSFDRVYELSGQSIARTAEFVEYLMSIVEEKVSVQKNGKRSTYTGKGKRQK